MRNHLRLLVFGVSLLLALSAAGSGWRYLLLPADVQGSAAVEFDRSDLPRIRTGLAALRIPSPTWGGNISRTRVLPFGLKPPYRLAWTMHARSLIELPPAVGYGRLYFGTHSGTFYAVDGRDGSVSWSRHLRCIASSPAVAEGVVYVGLMGPAPCHHPYGDVGGVVALSAQTGQTLWQYDAGIVESSPLLVGHLLYFGAYREDGQKGSLYAVDVRDHKRAWRVGGVGKVAGGAAYRQGVVYFASYDGHVYAVDARSGLLLWKSAALPTLPGGLGRAGFYATPSVAYGRVFIGGIDGRVYAFGAQSGDLLWATTLPHSGGLLHQLTSRAVGGSVYSSAAVYQQRVFVGSNDNSFYALSAATGKPLWHFRAAGKIIGSPTVMAGLVYFSTVTGHTYALAIDDGQPAWQFADGGYSPLEADQGHAYLVGMGRLYGLESVTPPLHAPPEGLKPGATPWSP